MELFKQSISSSKLLNTYARPQSSDNIETFYCITGLNNKYLILMTNMNKYIKGIIAALFVVTFSSFIYGQEKEVECKTYDSLLSTIKEGKTASYLKTAYIPEFSLVEKSKITVIPQGTPGAGFSVQVQIKDLLRGDNDNKYEITSVTGYFVAGCNNMNDKYKKLINTSFSFLADNTDDVMECAINGITEHIDSKYLINGTFVKAYKNLCFGESVEPIQVKKPAVYLYPVENMNIAVKVKVKGKLTLTEPIYNDGWNVTASPDGLIDNIYDYLFYEAELNKVELPEEGWVVAFDDIENWFDGYLPQMGLNTKEKEQFKEYWLKDLRKANYYEIRLLGDKFLKDNMDLIITPEPETILRLNFYFKPVSIKSELIAPEIKKVERKGFTVIEWGGINEGDLRMLP